MLFWTTLIYFRSLQKSRNVYKCNPAVRLTSGLPIYWQFFWLVINICVFIFIFEIPVFYCYWSCVSFLEKNHAILSTVKIQEKNTDNPFSKQLTAWDKHLVYGLRIVTFQQIRSFLKNFKSVDCKISIFSSLFWEVIFFLDMHSNIIRQDCFKNTGNGHVFIARWSAHTSTQ